MLLNYDPTKPESYLLYIDANVISLCLPFYSYLYFDQKINFIYLIIHHMNFTFFQITEYN